jgi:hypothetical protein
LWHVFFLALAQNFMDVDTVVPAIIFASFGDERMVTPVYLHAFLIRSLNVS